MQFDAAVSEAPEGFSGPFPFVPLFRYRDGETFFLNNRYQNQVIVLNSGDEARIIALESPAAEFDDFTQKAEEVLKTMEWIR
jgi:hypothetical protein